MEMDRDRPQDRRQKHLPLQARSRRPAQQFHPGSYAFHSDDIEYIFGTIDTRPGATWRPEDRVLSDQMMSYWTNFAKNGDPNGLDSKGQPLPNWPKYGEGDPVLHLDNPITSRPDENRAATNSGWRTTRSSPPIMVKHVPVIDSRQTFFDNRQSD